MFLSKQTALMTFTVLICVSWHFV